jgi:hypothetical protein
MAPFFIGCLLLSLEAGLIRLKICFFARDKRPGTSGIF